MTAQHAVTMAELRSAAGEPEPAEALELARAICEATGCPYRDDPHGDHDHLAAARVALRWMREREAGR